MDERIVLSGSRLTEGVCVCACVRVCVCVHVCVCRSVRVYIHIQTAGMYCQEMGSSAQGAGQPKPCRAGCQAVL